MPEPIDDLPEWHLWVSRASFDASCPEWGDASEEERGGPPPTDRTHRKLSMGVCEKDTARLAGLVGSEAQLVDAAEHESIRMVIDKVDPELKVLVGLAEPSESARHT
jgi:hypothetical protein